MVLLAGLSVDIISGRKDIGSDVNFLGPRRVMTRLVWCLSVLVVLAGPASACRYFSGGVDAAKPYGQKQTDWPYYAEQQTWSVFTQQTHWK